MFWRGHTEKRERNIEKFSCMCETECVAKGSAMVTALRRVESRWVALNSSTTLCARVCARESGVTALALCIEDVLCGPPAERYNVLFVIKHLNGGSHFTNEQ